MQLQNTPPWADTWRRFAQATAMKRIRNSERPEAEGRCVLALARPLPADHSGRDLDDNGVQIESHLDGKVVRAGVVERVASPALSACKARRSNSL